MALIDDFKLRFPEFTTSVVDTKFPLLEPEWPCYYGRPYGEGDACDDAAILMLLGHLFTMETAASAQPSRSQQSKSVGSVSVSYDAPTQSGGAMYDFFSSTKYGQRFLRLTAKHKGGFFV